MQVKTTTPTNRCGHDRWQQLLGSTSMTCERGLGGHETIQILSCQLLVYWDMTGARHRPNKYTNSPKQKQTWEAQNSLHPSPQHQLHKGLVQFREQRPTKLTILRWTERERFEVAQSSFLQPRNNEERKSEAWASFMCTLLDLGPLHTWAKSRDLVMVRTLDSHPKVIPCVLGKLLYVVTGPQA